MRIDAGRASLVDQLLLESSESWPSSKLFFFLNMFNVFFCGRNLVRHWSPSLRCRMASSHLVGRAGGLLTAARRGPETGTLWSFPFNGVFTRTILEFGPFTGSSSSNYLDPVCRIQTSPKLISKELIRVIPGSSHFWLISVLSSHYLFLVSMRYQAFTVVAALHSGY